MVNTYRPDDWIKYAREGRHEIWENKKLNVRADAYKIHGNFKDQL